MFNMGSIGIQTRIHQSSTAHHSYYAFWTIPAVDRHVLLIKLKSLIKKSLIGFRSESASAERKLFHELQFSACDNCMGLCQQYSILHKILPLHFLRVSFENN